jgi:sugar lactone lactonase YvrE
MTQATTRKITCVAPTGDRCAEAAVWSAPERAVYWTDLLRFLVHRYDADSGSVRSWLFDEPTVALALTTRPGTLLVALGSRLLLWRPETDARTAQGFVLPGSPRLRLNDGRADPLGNFWVGSMGNNVEPDGELGEMVPGQGVLYRIAPDGTVTEQERGIGISNTVCWSPDNTHFYFGDTLANEVRVYDYDAASGTIANGRPFLSGAARGLPDGSAIDADGHVWNCRFGGGCMLRVAPDGQIVETIEIPAPNVTTCTFGGADLKTLFVTTAGRPARRGDRLAGSLFSLPVETPGLKENLFRLA